MTISAHILVKNEYAYIWYVVMAIAPYVDDILLWDTGSTDGTLQIIESLRSDPRIKNKIHFESHPEEFNEELIRQQMLDKTTTDWFIVVDGDEIWWNDSIQKVMAAISTHGDKIESIVVPTINVVGDIYHFQESSAGNYHLAGRVGHYAIRAINRKIPGLHSLGRHGIWGWVDENNVQIQNRDARKILFIDAPYMHMTFLDRAQNRTYEALVNKRAFKRKYEIGIKFPYDFYYPEVFFIARPLLVPSVWKKMSSNFIYRAMITTPLKRIKRRLLPKKVGY